MKTEYSFFNLPKEYSWNDYEETTKSIVKGYASNKDVTAIYNWGNPSAAGISDIDIVIVFKKNPKSLPLLRRGFHFLTGKKRYLVRHPFVFIDEESFKNIRYIYQNTDFELLHGNDIAINDLSGTDLAGSKITLLNDLIIRHYPRDFISQFAFKKINVRDTLLRLNSLRYTFRLVTELTGIEPFDVKKLGEISGLRKNWFKSNDYDLLISLNEFGLSAAMDTIKTYSHFISEKDIVKIKSSNNVSYDGPKNRSVFVNNWDKKESIKKMVEALNEGKSFSSILPIQISAQMFEYSNYHGLISNFIRKNLKGKLDYSFKNKNVAKNRIKILNSQAELAIKLKHSDFPAFFDFGYRNKAGINNKVLNAASTIKG